MRMVLGWECRRGEPACIGSFRFRVGMEACFRLLPRDDYTWRREEATRPRAEISIP